LRPDFYFRTEYGIRLTVTFLIPWGALSDERTGLSFVCAAGSYQRSLSRVLFHWDLRPYFTVSHLRLPFLSPPTTRRVTVEVFDPASTLYNHFSRTTQKTQPLYCWEGVSTAPLHSNGSYSIVACLFVAIGMCLPSRCLAMNVYSDFTIPTFGRHIKIYLSSV
jgi:hypothetical protein